MCSLPKHVPVHTIKTKEMGATGIGVISLYKTAGKLYDSTVPHRHTFYELMLFTEAEGAHEIDFNRIPVQKYSVHFVSPGQIHTLMLKKNKGFVLCFTEDFVSIKTKHRFEETFPFYEKSDYQALVLNRALMQELTELITELNKELSSETRESEDICRSYLNIILLKLKQHYTAALNDNNLHQAEKNPKVNAFKKLIDENYLSHKTVADYAYELAVSPNYLNTLCKKQEGKTAIQCIQSRVLLEAKRLLYATNMNIKEISFLLHFDDVPYFNRFFKRQTGFTPMEYRTGLYKNR